jgi:hypothetical protein
MENLAQSSVNATVKSVARWTWNRYTGCGRCHRGVMALDHELPLQERQRLAAVRTHDVRNKATESRIRAAYHLLQQKGEALTQAAIGRVTGLTRQTVAAYKHVLNDAIKPAAVVALGRSSAKVGNVKYGVHQVTAASREACDEEETSLCPDLFPGGLRILPVLDG